MSTTDLIARLESASMDRCVGREFAADLRAAAELAAVKEQNAALLKAQRNTAEDEALIAVLQEERDELRARVAVLEEALRASKAECVYAGRAYKVIEEMANRLEQETKNNAFNKPCVKHNRPSRLE